jgi:hypothetical protein
MPLTPWDHQVMFLVYVAWTVPLRAGFNINIEMFSATWFFDTLVDVFFLSDVVLGFLTPYDTLEGVREGRVAQIASKVTHSMHSAVVSVR